VLQAFRSRMQVVFTIGSGSGRDHDLVEWLGAEGSRCWERRKWGKYCSNWAQQMGMYIICAYIYIYNMYIHTHYTYTHM
jgi:hypothetical protein